MNLLQPRYERPPEGLARGRWPAPAWVIAGIAALVVAAAVAFFWRNARRTRRGPPGAEPRSRRSLRP